MTIIRKNGKDITRTEFTDGQLLFLAQSWNPVPCNGCTACCKGDLIALKLHLGDKVEDYKCHQEKNAWTGQQEWVLDHKPNGDCVYLGATGCTIHARAPVVCREFDCRAVFLTLTKEQRREWVKMGAIKKSVFDAARKRLHTLDRREEASGSVFDAERIVKGWIKEKEDGRSG